MDAMLQENTYRALMQNTRYPATSPVSSCPRSACATATSRVRRKGFTVQFGLPAGVMAQPCMERMAGVPQPGQLVGVLLPVYPWLILPLTGAWATSLWCCQSVCSGAARPEHCHVASGSPILASFSNFRTVHVGFQEWNSGESEYVACLFSIFSRVQATPI
jgi:hypothetical protein